jgi:hypothetical protein
MRCAKNGRVVRSEGHGEFGYFHGDEYACPKCDARVVTAFGAPIRADQVTAEEKETAINIA